jgi:sugar/nucleoside kinase (ribokinase family)
VLKVNEIELALLGGLEEVSSAKLDELGQAACSVLEYGPKLVVVTLGKEGSYFQAEEACGYVPAFKVDSIDAVGCGDAFTAGLLSKLTSMQDWQNQLTESVLRDILAFANAVGALTSLKRGVIPALPYIGEVEEFLASK